MLFSIVIPVYNVEKYLSQCLDSIISQVDEIEQDCQILLIDDGSTDGSSSICDKYKENYPSLFDVYHKINEGLLATRRFGYSKASGQYIVNCDSDDLLEDRALLTLKEAIDRFNQPDILIFNYNSYDDGIRHNIHKDIFSDDTFSLIDKGEVLREFLRGHRIVSVWSKAIKSTCIDFDKDYGEYGRLSTGEDTLQSLEFFSNAKTFVYINEPLYNYRCGSGMTAKFDPGYYFSFKRIFEEIYKAKNICNIEDFDSLFAVKILQTAGRAITQSRLCKWESYSQHIQYLKEIRNDQMFQDNIKFLEKVRSNLQSDHYILLKMLQSESYRKIALLLFIKNKFSK